MRHDRAGFSLIELMVVVVIVGILATVVVPRFGRAQRMAFVSTMTADLRNLAIHQQFYYDSNAGGFTYSMDLTVLPDFEASDGVTVTMEEATSRGWSARAVHGGLPGVECVVYHGNAAPLATTDGIAPVGSGTIACDPA